MSKKLNAFVAYINGLNHNELSTSSKRQELLLNSRLFDKQNILTKKLSDPSNIDKWKYETIVDIEKHQTRSRLGFVLAEIIPLIYICLITFLKFSLNSLLFDLLMGTCVATYFLTYLVRNTLFEKAIYSVEHYSTESLNKILENISDVNFDKKTLYLGLKTKKRILMFNDSPKLHAFSTVGPDLLYLVAMLTSLISLIASAYLSFNQNLVSWFLALSAVSLFSALGLVASSQRPFWWTLDDASEGTLYQAYTDVLSDSEDKTISKIIKYAHKLKKQSSIDSSIKESNIYRLFFEKND